jgi:hypothetical protein
LFARVRIRRDLRVQGIIIFSSTTRS